LIKIKSEDNIQLLWFFINIVFCFSVFSGVRLDRVRGGRQKYKRSPDSQPIIQHILPMVKKACIEGNNNFGLREISITKCISFFFE
jgi:hypothetical protein